MSKAGSFPSPLKRLDKIINRRLDILSFALLQEYDTYGPPGKKKTSQNFVWCALAPRGSSPHLLFFEGHISGREKS